MMKKLILVLNVMLLAAAGCHAQIPPPTSYAVNLTWIAPVANGSWGGCTTAAPCTYAVYRATTTGTTCPVSSSTAWTEITTPSTRPSGTAYTDTGASGLDACYAVETVQGSANSAPSNTFNITVPATPGSPGSVTGAQQAAELAPQLTAPLPLEKKNVKEVAVMAPLDLKVR